MSTDQMERPSARSPRDTVPWLARAWTGVALIPVFFFLAFAVGEGAYALMGYKPESADAPLWVDLVALVPITVTFVVPCIAAVFFGSRATKSGDRRGKLPLVIGAIAGAGLLILTVVSEVENILQR